MTAVPRRGASLYLPAVRRAMALVAAAILLCQIAMSLYAWALADQFLVPALERKAQDTGLAVARNLTRAMAAGVPWEKMEGIQEYFDRTLAENPDLAYIILTDNAGRPLVRAGHGGEVLAPEQYVSSVRHIERRYVSYAQVHVGVDRRFISYRVHAARIDGAVLALASAVLALEVAWFAFSLRFVAPLRQLGELLGRMGAGDYRYRAGPGVMTEATNAVQARLNQAYFELGRMIEKSGRSARTHPVMGRLRTLFRFAEGGFARDLVRDRSAVMRLLAFLFLFGEALTRAFLPQHAAALPGIPDTWPPLLARALPATAAFTGFVLSVPLARDWSMKWGQRPAFAAGALVAAVAFAACAMAPDYSQLVVARAIAGAGFALMLCASTRTAPHSQERRTGTAQAAMVAAALLAAETCAPALGGILAQTSGARAVFGTGAAVMLLAACAAFPLLEPRAAPARRAPMVMAISGPPRAARTPQDTLLLLASTAVSSSQRLLLGALFAFAIPVWLAIMQLDPSRAGRYQLALGACLAMAVLVARMRAWRTEAYLLLAASGCALALAGALPFMGSSGKSAQLAGLLLFGLGAVLAGGAQLAVISRSLRAAMLRRGSLDRPAVYSFLEGCALAAGPMVAAALFTIWGPREGLVMLAWSVCAAAAVNGALYLMFRQRSAA